MWVDEIKIDLSCTMIKNVCLIDHTYNLEAWLTNEQAIYAIVSYLPVSYLLSILMSSKLKSFAHWKLFGNLFGIPGAFHFYFSGTRNVLGDNPTGGCLFLKSCHLDTVQGSSLSIIWNPILEKDNRSLKKSRLLDNNHMRIDCRSIPSQNPLL